MLRSYQTCHCHDWKTLALSKLQRIQEKLFQAVRTISCPVQPLKPDSLVASAKINARASVGQANEKNNKSPAVRQCNACERATFPLPSLMPMAQEDKKEQKQKDSATFKNGTFLEQYIKGLRDNFSLIKPAR